MPLDSVAATGSTILQMSGESSVDNGASNAIKPGTTPWEYLREQAHRCMRLARTCPDRVTSHALEAMGMEFLEQAAEMEKKNSIPPAETNDPG